MNLMMQKKAVNRRKRRIKIEDKETCQKGKKKRSEIMKNSKKKWKTKLQIRKRKIRQEDKKKCDEELKEDKPVEKKAEHDGWIKGNLKITEEGWKKKTKRKEEKNDERKTEGKGKRKKKKRWNTKKKRNMMIIKSGKMARRLKEK